MYPGGSGGGGGGGGLGGGGVGGGGEGATKTSALVVVDAVRLSMGTPMCVAKSVSLVVSYRVFTVVASVSVSMKRVNVTRTLAASNVTRMSDASGYSTRSAARSAA